MKETTKAWLTAIHALLDIAAGVVATILLWNNFSWIHGVLFLCIWQIFSPQREIK
jgi:hypothetical protein